MLAPVKVVNPRVMPQQYPDKDHRQRRKFEPKKPKQKKSGAQIKGGANIDITA